MKLLYKLKTSYHFDSAHFLQGYDGKCSNIHGHRWHTEAVISGENLIETGTKRGMLVDFGDFKRDLREICDYFDHSLIFEQPAIDKKLLDVLNTEKFRLVPLDCRPTAENLARIIYCKLKNKGYNVYEVTVYESPENGASYSETD